MASYNGAKWLLPQLESIEDQLFENINIIVSDDNSSDKTIDILSDFSRNSRCDIEFLNSQNKILSSRGHANNFFKLILDSPITSDTAWVAFSDQDDIWLPDKLRRAVEFLESNSSYGGWSSAVTAFWNEGKSLYIPKHGFVHKYNHFRL